MSTVTTLGAFTLGDLNISLNTVALPLLNQLLSLLDTLLSAPGSLGAFKTAIAAQLTGLLSASATLSLGDPAAAVTNLLNMLAATLAALKAALNTSPKISVGIQASAIAAAAQTIRLQLAAIDALLALINALRGLLSSTYASIFAKMSAGGIALYSINGPAATVAADLASTIAGGISGGSGPLATIRGILMVTESPTVFATMSSVLKTS